MKILYENDFIPSDLEKSIKENKVLHPFFELGFNGIKIKNYCGFLHIKNETFFISPKISKNKEQNQKIFLYMLMYAKDIKLSNEDMRNLLNQKYTILEFFIKYFSDKLLEELKVGVFKTYIRLQESLKVLKGSYKIEKNFTSFYNQNIVCEYDEFSSDNELNRFLLFAINNFKKFSNYKNLYRCEMVFDEVTLQHFEINSLNIKYDRLNKRYAKIVQIALFILSHLISMPKNSKDKSFAFLFDMAEVFEKFIAKLYKKTDKTTKLQVEKSFGNLKLKPDIITQNSIIDTKYKKINSYEDISTADKYQMFTYGINFNIKNITLLYPKFYHNIEKKLQLGKESNQINLTIKTIDLDSQKEFLEYIEEIKIRLFPLAEPRTQ